jgi:prolyl-tRNA synthetase
VRYSRLFGKTIKNAPKDEVAVNAKLLTRGGFIRREVAGVYNYLPLGIRVLNKISNIIREEMNAIGGQEVLLSSLQNKESWEKTGRWDTFDALLKVKTPRLEIEYPLGPTHEEVISPLAKQFIQSYKDLPLYLYQIQTKFRNELRAKSGLLRGREFLMKDLYSFHLTQEDLNNYYEKVIKAYFKILNKLNIGEKTYLTFASGGTFSKYSHEFQTVSQAGEDSIYICQNCKQAVNKEIFDEVKICPNCKGKDFKEEKAIESGNIFKLMTKYSKPFDLYVADKDGSKKEVLMGCYGLGPSRLIGTIVELNNDDKGIVWPKEVAPYDVHLINLKDQNSNLKSESQNSNLFGEKVYEDLQKVGIEVLYDDREDVSAGAKFADADLIGIPIRLVVSKRTLRQGSGQAGNKVEFKERKSEKSELLALDQIIKRLA